MDVVLADAQRLGYAEADPSADIDGDDAAAKLVVLAGIAFRRHLRLTDIPKTLDPSAVQRRLPLRRAPGLHDPPDLQVQATEGRLSRLRRSGAGAARLELRPQQGANNVVTIYGQYGGESSFSGAGAGGPATAVAVVSDLLALTQGGPRPEAEEWLPAALVAPPPLPYYLRFVVQDRPGILASIAAALARQDINLDAVLQEPGYPKDALPFVITVEPCRGGGAACGAAAK